MSELVRQERLRLCDAIELEEPRTRLLIALLRQLGVVDNRRMLLITAEHHESLALACRNVVGVNASEVAHIDPVSLIDHDTVILTSAALKKLELSLQ